MVESLIISGWPSNFSTEEIESVLRTVGPLSEIDVTDDISPESHTKSARVKYETEDLTNNAIKGFQDFQLGDMSLQVLKLNEIEKVSSDLKKSSISDPVNQKVENAESNGMPPQTTTDEDTKEKDLNFSVKEKDRKRERSREKHTSSNRERSKRERKTDSRDRSREKRPHKLSRQSKSKSKSLSNSRSRNKRFIRRRDSSRENRRHRSRSSSRGSRSSRSKNASGDKVAKNGVIIPAALSSLPETVALGLVAQGITSLPEAITNPPPPIPVPGMNPINTIGTGVVGNLNDPSVKAQLEIFVGNVPPGCSPHALMEFLNAAMHQVKLVKGHGDPILSARISQKFAFATFRTADEATAALNMTGIPFMGSFLKIQRPSNYRGPPDYPNNWQVLIGQAPPSSIPPPSTLALLDPNTKIAREIFVGNVPLDADGNTIVQFLNSAMIQVGLSRAPGNPIVNIRMNNRFSFLEFRSVEEASSALFMNNIPFANTNLIFSRPSKYAGPVTPSRTWFELLAENALMKQSPGDTNISYSTPQPSTVVRIGSVVSPEELSTEDGFQEVLEDMNEECRKYGTVKNIVIPKPGQAGTGYIYVHYASIDEATKAKNAFSSRTFDGQKVDANYFPEDHFHQRIF